MPSRSDLGAWLGDLPAEVAELRARAGEDKRNLDHVGVVPRDADGICEDVDAAGFGPVFRVYAYDKAGKQVTSRLFYPDGQEGKAAGKGAAEQAAPTSQWDALWRMHTSQAEQIGKLIDGHIRLLDASAAPLRAMADLFVAESERRAEAEAAVMDASERISELENVAERASDELERGGEDTSNDPIRREAARMLRGLADQFGVPRADDDADAADASEGSGS